MNKKQNQEKNNNEASQVFGKIIKAPLALVYCFSAILIGAIVGAIASITLPIFIPYQMIKVRFFKSGTWCQVRVGAIRLCSQDFDEDHRGKPGASHKIGISINPGASKWDDQGRR